MTLTEAVNQTALAVARALLDLGFTEAEVARAIEIMVSMNTQAMRESQLLLCREPKQSYYLFLAHDDEESKRTLERCKAEYGTVASGTSLFEVMSSTWWRLWGDLWAESTSESY